MIPLSDMAFTMRGSTRHNFGDTGIVAAAFVMLVIGAWIAESGGFAFVIALIAICLIAVFVPIAVMLHEERNLPSNPRRPHA
jgi:Na+/melibiose symporter-like transporter